MQDPKKIEAFYSRLKTQLEETTTWPALYLYKFIVPADPHKISQIEVIFDLLKAEINTRDSAKGNFTSVSIKAQMESPEAVIQKYLEVSNIEGVISL